MGAALCNCQEPPATQTVRVYGHAFDDGKDSEDARCGQTDVLRESSEPVQIIAHPKLDIASKKKHSEEGSFEVCLSRSKRPFGMVISYNGRRKAVLVEHVKPGGALEEWNETHPDKIVVVGSWIQDVNGIADADGIRTELRCASEVTMRIRNADKVEEGRHTCTVLET
mmetsp:Transcript_57574/g.136925  ORF Transcript_57574/g.136925 Transcript_57574/m.136925 type:complete len:168 (+) Transcript_57574:86-589(+)